MQNWIAKHDDELGQIYADSAFWLKKKVVSRRSDDYIRPARLGKIASWIISGEPGELCLVIIFHLPSPHTYSYTIETKPSTLRSRAVPTITYTAYICSEIANKFWSDLRYLDRKTNLIRGGWRVAYWPPTSCQLIEDGAKKTDECKMLNVW